MVQGGTLQKFLALERLYALMGEAERALEDHIGVSICRAGCGYCCKVNVVPLHTLEAQYIASHAIGHGRAAELASLAEGWLLERHAQARTYEGEPGRWRNPVLTRGRVLGEYQALAATPCPFLGEDLRCTIHDWRPLICRTFGVTRDPSERCPRPAGRGETAMQKAFIGGDGAALLKAETGRVFGDLDPNLRRMGLIPTMVFRELARERFRRLVADNRIASAKLIGSDVNTALYWQDQVDAIRGNEREALVLAR